MIKPILFNTEMVRAILAGQKTVTRRVVKLKYSNTHLEMRTDKYGTRLIEIQNEEPGVTTVRNPDGTTTHKLLAAIERVPPYHPGDILYVRETWAEIPDLFGEFPEYIYRANYAEESLKMDDESGEAGSDFPACVKWRPSIHMPKEAARLFLRVTGVRVERLRDITEEQAKKEGAEPAFEYSTPEGPVITLDEAGYRVLGFKALWDSTIKKTNLPLYGWDANPWVWVIEFERCEKPQVLAPADNPAAEYADNPVLSQA